MSLSVDANERLYDALAETLDRVGPANEALYLTKLALSVATKCGGYGKRSPGSPHDAPGRIARLQARAHGPGRH
jgi:hypothetical protein